MASPFMLRLRADERKPEHHWPNMALRYELLARATGRQQFWEKAAEFRARFGPITWDLELNEDPRD